MIASTTIGFARSNGVGGTIAPMPKVPVLGRKELYYAQRAKQAERAGDVHSRSAYKAAQYITLALDPLLAWDVKVKYFQHALDRHCDPPPYPDDATWIFYGKLSDLVRQHAGREALRLASQEDDLYAARLSMGQRRAVIENDAERFFAQFAAREACPNWLNEAAFEQLKILRNHWI